MYGYGEPRDLPQDQHQQSQRLSPAAAAVEGNPQATPDDLVGARMPHVVASDKSASPPTLRSRSPAPQGYHHFDPQPPPILGAAAFDDDRRDRCQSAPAQQNFRPNGVTVVLDDDVDDEPAAAAAAPAHHRPHQPPPPPVQPAGVFGARSTPVPPRATSPPTTAAQLTLRTKVIVHQRRPTRIVLQDQSGPCPLIALANALALRGDLTVPVSRSNPDYTSSALLCNALASLASHRIGRKHITADGAAFAIDEIIDRLPRLTEGMYINVGFRGPTDYECTADTTIFDALGIRLLHGWVATETNDGPCAKLLHKHRYDGLLAKLTMLDDGQGSIFPGAQGGSAGRKNSKKSIRRRLAFLKSHRENKARKSLEAKQRDSLARQQRLASFSSSLVNNNSDSRELSARGASVDAQSGASGHNNNSSSASEALFRKHAQSVARWLHNSRTQLSYSGLVALQSYIATGEIVVFFRGDHYAVMTKGPGDILLQLVTGVEAALAGNVWKTVVDPDGAHTQLLPGYPTAAHPVSDSAARVGGSGSTGKRSFGPAPKVPHTTLRSSDDGVTSSCCTVM